MRLLYLFVIYICVLFILLNCNYNKSNNYGDYQSKVYADTIIKNGSKIQILIMMEWFDSDKGYLFVEKDSADFCPKNIEHYLFHRKEDAIILSSPACDNIDTCYVKNITNEIIVLFHNNDKLFFSDQKTTRLTRWWN